MSAAVQALPSSLSRFGHDRSLESQTYPATYGYVGVGSLPQHSSYSTFNYQQGSPHQHHSPYTSQNLRATSSSRSSELSFRSPQIRDRTPIRRQRSRLQSRDSSASRPEMLLAYATEQQQMPILPSQAVQSGSGAYRTTTYAPPTTEPYSSQPLYYTSPPLQQQVSSFTTESSVYGPGTNQLPYYQIQSSATHQPDVSASAFNLQDPLYISNPAATGPRTLQSPEDGLNPFPPTSAPLESSREDFRGTTTRPKPQCFEHGCNGREFSTFSNLLRHQRERSGNATKATCPDCGTEFTRTTARNGHLTSGKCKGREGQGPSSGVEEGSS